MDFNIETYAERTSFERNKKQSKIHNNFSGYKVKILS